MPPDMGRASPRGPARNASVTRQGTEPRSRLRVTPATDELAARRELLAWIAAVEHLNCAGLAAAVPLAMVLPLQRRGLVVWAAERRAA
jgi:hypothetical protein